MGNISAQYTAFRPVHPGLLSDMNRREARESFDDLMRRKEERIGMLRDAVSADGVDLDGSDESIRALDKWFVAHVEADPGDPGRLSNTSYSLVNDITLYLGEVLMQRAPYLHWHFQLGGKKHVSYQRHVLAGFPTYKGDNHDLDLTIGGYGHRLIEGQEEQPGVFFVDHLATVLNRVNLYKELFPDAITEQ